MTTTTMKYLTYTTTERESSSMGIITLTHDDNNGESCYHWGTRKIENR